MHRLLTAPAALIGALAAFPLCSGCAKETEPSGAELGAQSASPPGSPASSQSAERVAAQPPQDSQPPATLSASPNANVQQPSAPPATVEPDPMVAPAPIVSPPAPPTQEPEDTPLPPSTSAPETAMGGQGGQAPMTAGGMAPLPPESNAGGQAGAAEMNTGGQAGAAMMEEMPPRYQSDPGIEGDGTFEQAKPYRAVPETSELLNGAPEGKLSGSEGWRSPLVFEDWWFDYRVYVPAQYQDGKPAALLIMQDGTGSYGFLPRVMDNLIHSGDMPVTIGVFIEPGTKKGPGERHADAERSECYDTVSDRYARMLVEEFLPEVLTDYDIVEDPDGWAIGGNSSGGAAAFTAGWFMPDTFRKILTNIGSFTRIAPGKTGKDTGAELYPMYIRETEPTKPLRVTLRSGTGDLDNQYGNWLEANFAMAEALEEKGYHYRFVHGSGGHNTEHAKADVVTAMQWLWRGYQLPHYP